MTSTLSYRITMCIAALLVVAAGRVDAMTFTEVGGVVFGEAENFTTRTPTSGSFWKIVPDERLGSDGAVNIDNARGGKYLTFLPDGGPGGSPASDPSVEYAMQINTPGEYQLYVRWEIDQPEGNSDSLFVDVIELKGAGVADWYELVKNTGNSEGDQNFASSPWDAGGEAEQNGPGAANNPMVWDIAAPGTYTLRFSHREDGAALDAFVFQRSNLAAPTGNGPTDAAAGNVSGALLYYNFESPDDLSDDIVTDSSGNGRAGVFSTTGSGSGAFVLGGAPGTVGSQSLQLNEDGGNAARLAYNDLSPNSSLDLDTDTWSLATFFNRDDTDNHDFIFHIGDGDGFGGGNEIHLNGVDDSDDLNLRVVVGGSTIVNETILGAAPAGEWEHVLLAHDAGASAILLYLNGQLVVNETLSMSLNNDNAITFGGHDSGGNLDRLFDGLLDEIVLYDRLLTNAEVVRLANGHNPLNLAVPEPSTACLALLGLAGMARRRRLHKR